MRRTAAILAALLLVPATARAAAPPSVDERREPPGEAEDDADVVELGPPGTMRARADNVSFDAGVRSLELSGDVRIDAPPFHLRSDRIDVARTRYGVSIDGKGTLAFCPCLGTPLRVDFDHALVAPPGDLVLKDPTLRVYGVPVFYLPYFWLRSDEKFGLLPPDLAYRGQDGVFAGGGVHVPFGARGQKSSLDLRAGAYVLRGFAASASLRTPSSMTSVRVDRLPGSPAPAVPFASDDDTGVFVDARGATHAAERGGASAAWDADVVRGRRGLAATTDLEEAAKPWDRAAIEGSVVIGPFVLAEGARAVSRRGGGGLDVDAAGPTTALGVSGAASRAITYDAAVEGGALRLSGLAAAPAGPGAPSPETFSYARFEGGVLGATSLGPLAASLSLRAAGDVAAEATRDGASRAEEARAHLGAPLARSFGEGPDPVVHVVEPFVEAAALDARGDGVLGVLPGGGASAIDGTAPVAEAGVSTNVGRWATREALEATVAIGAAFGSSDRAPPGAPAAASGDAAALSGARPLGRARIASTLGLFGLSAEAASVLGASAAADGFAGLARARLGPRDGVRLVANVATREGLDPVLARVLSSAPLEPPAGLLAAEGTTGGAGIVVPWSRWVTTDVGADADATTGDLVAARAGLELRDRCGCLTLRANGAHRIGRRGVDVWVALDFASDR